jgi:hypothetical protein
MGLLEQQRDEERGEQRVEPEAIGVADPPPITTPITVPSTQPMYCGVLAPAINQGSKPPSPPLAAAHEASTVVIASPARESQAPVNEGESASPIAR